ncbi:MAG: murein biosynthesis integral membrane protein MurJ [Verrucomicrobiota bacterium]
MLKSSGAMALATLASRVLGMVREMVYAGFLDTGWVADAFFAAFQIPNLFRRLLGEGALTAAFIPAFTEKQRTDGEKEMWRAANAVISGLVVAAAVIIALAMVGITVALSVHQFSAQTDLMLRLLRLMFPYMLMVCVAAVMMGMLNARGHFFIPAMGATMLNVAMIASVLWLAPKFGTDLPPDLRLSKQIFALAIGVLVAGVAQAAFQLPTLYRDGFRWRWETPWGNETVRRVVTKMIPGTLGVAAFQINVVMVQIVSLIAGQHIVSSFNFATRLMELPQGMFGISLATFLLPTLTTLALEKNFTAFRTNLRHGIATMLFANLIASVLLTVLAEPIVRLLFEHRRFTPESTQRVAFALMCLAPGLCAFSSVNILARAFYALNDTKTPMKISIVCLALNLPLSFLFVWRLQQGGLGVANTISSVVNLLLLAYALRKKLKFLDWGELKKTLPLLLGATALAGMVAWLAWQGWERSLGHATLALQIGAVFVPAGIAALVYWLAAVMAKIPAAHEITGLVFRKFRR